MDAHRSGIASSGQLPLPEPPVDEMWNHADLRSGHVLTPDSAPVNSPRCANGSSGQQHTPDPTAAETQNHANLGSGQSLTPDPALNSRRCAIASSGQLHASGNQGPLPTQVNRSPGTSRTLGPTAADLSRRADAQASSPRAAPPRAQTRHNSSNRRITRRTRHIVGHSSRRWSCLTTRSHRHPCWQQIRNRERCRKIACAFSPTVLFTTTKLSPIGICETQWPLRCC